MGSGKILIVDEQIETTSEIAGLLSAWELEVSRVGDPKDLRAKLQSNRPDLILAAIRLCGDARFGILKSVNKFCPRATLIVLGTSATTVDTIRALEIAGRQFLRLPVSSDALFIAIHRALNHTRCIRRYGEISESINTLRNVLLLHTETLERLTTALAGHGGKPADGARDIDETAEPVNGKERTEQQQVIKELKAFVNLLREEVSESDRNASHQTNLKALLGWLDEIESSHDTQPTSMSLLSGREMQVFALIKAGMTSEGVADRLHISLDTVKTHRRNIRKKLGIIGNRGKLGIVETKPIMRPA